jgi:phosphoglycolate phosphatase
MALVLVDLDGTLVDPGPGIIGSCRYALESLGRAAPPDADLRWIIGPPLRQTLATLLGPGGDAERAVELYRERYSAWGLFEAAVYPGVPEALGALRDAGHRLVVCTAKPTVFARRVVDHFGLASWFDEVRGAELDARFDDKADLIEDILAREGSPSPACMVGDRRHDVAAAARNAIPAVGVLWGYGDAAELSEADGLCERPEDLAAVIGRSLAGA